MIEAQGGQAELMRFDVSQKEQAEAAAVAEELGLTDVFCIPMKSEETNESGFAAVIDDFVAKI